MMMSIKANRPSGFAEERELAMLNILPKPNHPLLDDLTLAYRELYGNLPSDVADTLHQASQLAMQHLRQSNASYHDVQHTLLVVEVGREILNGRHRAGKTVDPNDWLDFIVSLMMHDIGYIRGACQGDTARTYVDGLGGPPQLLPEGTTDAWLAPHHVDRSKYFVAEHFSGHSTLRIENVKRNIEATRFPVTDHADPTDTDYPSLARSADLIGQLGDPEYLRKLPALFLEFEETGANEQLDYTHPQDMRLAYPEFYQHHVRPHIACALDYLRLTARGQQWVANLNGNLMQLETEALATRR
jgi:hypothetical protein